MAICIDLSPKNVTSRPLFSTLIQRCCYVSTFCAVLAIGSLASAEVQSNSVRSVAAASSVRGLTGSGTRGLTGSGARGLTGSGSRGLTGSGSRGLTGSGSRGLTGSGSRGLTSSGSRGLTGSGSRGLTGSGSRGLTGSGSRGLTGSGSRSFAPGFAVAAIGPVESLEVLGESATVTVLGQQFVSSAAAAESLAVGDYILAAVESGGETVVYSLGEAYVPGASMVGVRGPIVSADHALATVVVGAASIDYSAQLSADPTLAPAEGTLIEAMGIQPLAQGRIIVGLQSGDALAVQTSVDVSSLSQQGAPSGGLAGSDRQ